MKSLLFWVGTFSIFGVANGMIAQKETAIRNGIPMYLRLAPVDPRSLMQGDYMVLRYELSNTSLGPTAPRRGRLVVKLDANHVASFVRVHQGEPLQPGEHLLRYIQRHRLMVAPESFFFQEGHASSYNAAQYGELRVAPSGESVLVGLRKGDFTDAAPQS